MRERKGAKGARAHQEQQPSTTTTADKVTFNGGPGRSTAPEGQAVPVTNQGVAVGAAVLAIALYCNTVNHDFTFDDLVGLKNGHAIRALSKSTLPARES